MQPKAPIAILCAMDSEVRSLIASLKTPSVQTHGGVDFHTGLLAERLAVVVRCGIGKVNAARVTQMLIDLYAPRVIINSGVAGGIAPELRIADIVVATDLVEHDFDLTVFGNAKGYVFYGESNREPSRFKSDPEWVQLLFKAAERVLGYGRVHTGTVVSGDRFIASTADKRELREAFSATAAEMEGAAMAHVAALSEVPFVVLRAISDLADGQAPESFETFETKAAETGFAILMEALSRA